MACIEVDGEYLDAARADLRSLRQKVGMVFQQFNLFPHLTVGENVMLAPQVVQKVPKAKAAVLARADAGPGWAGREVRRLSRSPVRRPATARSPLPVPWLCRPRCCCAMRSPRPWTRSWSTKCSAWCASWPRTV